MEIKLNPWTVWHRKKKAVLDKFAYVDRDSCLLWGSCRISDVRTFESKDDALRWLDKKWIKYGQSVSEWVPVKTERVINYWNRNQRSALSLRTDQ